MTSSAEGNIQGKSQGSLLVAFAERTSAHGVSRLAQGSLPQKLIWFLIIVAASCGFCLHLHQLVSKYTELPVSTSFTDNERVQFPWVTICPTEYLIRESVITGTLRGTTTTRPSEDMLSDISRLYHRLLDQPNWNKTVHCAAADRLEDGKLGLRSQFFKSRTIYQDTHETIVYCEFNSELCSFLNFSLYKDEKYFACVTFQPKDGARTLVQAGEDGGLFLLLFSYGTGFYNFREQVESSSSFKVAFHEPGCKPDMSAALTIPVASKALIQFSAVTEETIDRQASPCLQSMPNATYIVDYSRPGDFENATFYGSVQDCLIRAQQQEFIRECGCLGDHLAIPSDLMQQWPLCHDLPDEVHFRNVEVVEMGGEACYFTILNDSQQYQPLRDYVESKQAAFDRSVTIMRCFETVRHRQRIRPVRVEHCKQSCRRAKFPAVRSSEAWPPNSNPTTGPIVGSLIKFVGNTITLADRNLRSVDRMRLVSQMIKQQLRTNYAVLRIYSMSTQVTHSKEDLAYELKNVFSDLGGILDLWVGVSVITLIEVLELAAQFFHVCLLRGLGNRRRKVDHEPCTVDNCPVDDSSDKATDFKMEDV